MNLEKLSQPIKPKSLEEHERMLAEKITELRLKYVEALFSRSIPPTEKKIKTYELKNGEEMELEKDLPLNDLGFLIKRYTTIIRDLCVNFKDKQEAKGVKWDSGMYDSIEEKYENQIVSFYENNRTNWVEKTMNFLKDEGLKMENSRKDKNFSLEDNKKKENQKRQAGLIYFDEDTGYDFFFDDPNIPSPVKKEDTCICIHMDSLFEKKYENPEINIFSSKSLEKLALKIVDEFPETKVIIGQSWLLDTPIAERIGFKIYRKKDSIGQGPSFWSQFINSKGQLDSKRVNKFLETGIPPYRVAIGFIKTEDFLRKYLPKERKGKILLKEIDPNFNLKKLEENMLSLKEVGKMWDYSNEEELRKFLSQNELFIKFNESQRGKGFLDFLLREKRKNIKKEDLDKDKKIHKYNDLLQEFIKEEKFINKEVIIE